ncbi:hypothetical protein IJ765_02375 [Candidatus Saccharibacteria bacterium]|nr:hypothetical protein [Candidatus Saccharibacteria bacterium]
MYAFAETVTLTDEQAATAIAGGLLGSIFTFGLLFYILTVIAGWKIFEKAGEKGWKSLIPIYNNYLLYKIVGMQNWFWWMIIAYFAANLVFSLNGFNTNMTAEEVQAYDFGAHIWVIIAMLAASLFALVADIKHSIALGKAFGKGTGFIVAMILFPNICWLILGLGKAKFNKKALKN